MRDIKVSNTSGNSKYPDAVRVYCDGLLIAEVFPCSRNPLQYLKDYPGSKYNRQLKEQMLQAGLTDEDVQKVYE